MNDRLERGIQYSLQGWIPINESILTEVRTRHSEGRYTSDPELLTRDLKRDPALALSVLRQLCEASDRDALVANCPEVLLQSGNAPAIAALLERSSQFSSSHRFDASTPVQSATMVRSVVSTSVSEQLGTQLGLAPGLAFGAASLRALGHLLISWNYPHLYEKVLRELGPDTSFDQLCAAKLGFSPTLLAVTIARRWNLSPEVRIAVNDHTVVAERELIERGRLLEKVCRTGEAIARTLYPDDFPSAQVDWNEASAFVQQQLGPDGMKALLNAARAYVKNFIAGMPHLGAMPERLDRPTEIVTHKGTGHASNRYLAHCPPALRKQLEEIYTDLRGSAVDRNLLEKLLHQAIPQAGFERGCIYLLDPDSLTLQPRIAVGSIAINQINAHRVHRSPYVEQESVISAALSSGIPQEINQSQFDKTTQDAIAGALGVEHRTGVLYLEAGDALCARPAQERLQLFKAIRQTLNDVLHLT